MAPISLPCKAKSPPVAGHTGSKHRGVYAETDADLRFHAQMRRKGNVGVRLPEDVVGIDVDVRHAGDTTVAMLAAALGPLPPTLHSTSRDDGSRIAFYRVPTGLRWRDVGEGVETVWWGSRYAVAWPSVHPDTGAVYHWHTADDERLDGVPSEGWALAAALPAAWVDALTSDVEESDGPVDLAVLRPDVARARVRGTLDWLREAKDGERNKRIYDAGVLLGGFWARLPDDVTEEDDLTHEALQEAARKAFADLGVAPDEPKANDTLQRGWEAGLRAPAADNDWDGDVGSPADDFAPEPGERPRKRMSVDVANDSDALQWCKRAVGTGDLAGMFLRGDELVYTARVGEAGYVPPAGKKEQEDGTVRYDEDGPAQVRRLSARTLAAYVDHHTRVYKSTQKAGPVPAIFPEVIAGRALSAPELLGGARRLNGVTTVPLVLHDGSVLSEPGYHRGSGLLYLPTRETPAVPGRLTRADAEAALATLLDVVADFPFVSEHDRANWLAALLTPVMKVLVPPPYPLVAIGAPSAGSGKSLLAWVLREVVGGVFRSEMARDGQELRKQITTILDKTVGAFAQFDNVRGTLRSSALEGLLTSDVWSDRLLGENTEVTAPNDRVWVLTGNNLSLGGDLRRRTVWSWIDAKMERPEERTAFRHTNLKAHVREHRGDLLAAMVTVVAAWVQAGRPSAGGGGRSDDFAEWQQATRGVLAFGGFTGVVNHADTVRRSNLSDEDEAGTLFEALFRRWGSRPWTPRETSDAVEIEDGIVEDDLPGRLAEKVGRPGFSKSLGWWLSDHEGQVHRGVTLHRSGTKKWRLDHDLL
ncbi:hypothetical protein GCM10009815_13550 [Nocardioides marmoribigeumensis]